MSRPPESDEDNVSDLAAFRAKKQNNAGHAHTGAGFGLSSDPAPGRGLSREPARRALRLHVPPATPRRFTVRVELVDSEPAIWRRLELPSQLTLDVVHDALQAAFGWANSHLHRFTPGDDQYGWETEGILTPFDIAEGDDGTPEVELRLDQLLGQKGDTLYYTYDFGDNWVHRITLESAQPASAAARPSKSPSKSKPSQHRAPDAATPAERAVICTAGERLGPPEDVGGIHWYEHLLEARTDRRLADNDDLVDQLAHHDLFSFRDEIDLAAIDLAAINRQLDRAMSAADGLTWLRGAGSAVLRPDILELVARQGDEAQRFLAGFLYRAGLAEPSQPTSTAAESTTAEPMQPTPAAAESTTADPSDVEPAVAEKATSVIRRFLGLVGEGITLTAAGFLPPKHVVAMMAELDPDQNWIGVANRESQTQPLLALREAVTDLGLTRKYRGMLLLTKRGAQLKDDPTALWRYLAERLPVERTTHGREFGLLLLMLVAAGEAISLRSVRSSLDLLTAMVGWQMDSARPGSGRYGNADAIYFTRGTANVLKWGATGLLVESLKGRYSPDGQLSPDVRYPLAATQARQLATAALRAAR